VNLVRRLKVKILGKAFVGRRIREGWKAALPFYAFKCQVHGLVETWPSGWAQVLLCPLCIEALMKARELIR
jgi:hypothetical protein